MLAIHTLREVASLFAFCCLFSLQSNASSAQGEFRIHDEERLRPAREAGLRSDRARIPELISILQEKPTPTRFLMETTLYSLAQLGATDALPAINALIQNGKDQDGKDQVELNIIHAAIADRARLNAEAGAGPETGSQAQAEAKLDRFYSELGEKPADINSAVSVYTKEVLMPSPTDLSPKCPLELYAMRALADMAYHSHYKDFAKLVGMGEVNFALDPRSALKVRLAPLSDTERSAWLVQDLSHKTVLTTTEAAEIQLAGEMGVSIGPVAAAKIQEMDQDRGQYRAIAFDAIFGVLSVSGSPERALLDHYKADTDSSIAEYARKGGTSDFIAGY